MKKITKTDNIFDLLSDGEWHTRQEIKERCFVPHISQVARYVGYVRKSRCPAGHLIICELRNRTLGFRLVKKYVHTLPSNISTRRFE